jgi:hypothetical protein
MACGECLILQANLLKLDFYELSNCQDEAQVVFDVAPFFKERSLVRVE